MVSANSGNLFMTPRGRNVTQPLEISSSPIRGLSIAEKAELLRKRDEPTFPEALSFFERKTSKHQAAETPTLTPRTSRTVSKQVREALYKFDKGAEFRR